jgi:hypothetical protein
MRKLFPYLMLIIAATGCAEDEANPCETPYYQLYVNEGVVHPGINLATIHGFFEVEYGPNGFAQGSGTTVTINANSEITGLSNGAYDLYLRGNCGGDSWSDWAGPTSFLIEGGQTFNCPTPTNVRMVWMSYDFNMLWDHAEGGYYEVDYALEGVPLGSGTVVTVSDEGYSDAVITKNNSYRFYVRANCGAEGWSNWSPMVTFFADQNANRCLPPTNVTANRQNGGIQFNFVSDGEGNHEVSITQYYGQPLTGDLMEMDGSQGGFYSSMSSSNWWYVYVRAICADGSRSAWSQAVTVQ